MTEERGIGAAYEMTPDLELSVVPTRELDQTTKDEIVNLCNLAFDEDGYDILFDLVAYAVNPTHVLARANGVLVSHAIWATRQIWLEDGTPLKTAYLDAVATHPEWQRRGIGSAVIRRLVEEVRDYDIGCLSTSRVNFYRNVGWELWTGPKVVKTETGLEDTPNYTVMILRTEHTPRLDKDSRLTIKSRQSDPW